MSATPAFVPRFGTAEGLRHLTEGDDLYEAMLVAIAGAQERLCMESYIFAADGI